MKYVFPAVITREDDFYLVEFPDTEGYFGCHTYGGSLYEVLDNAEDALNLMLWYEEKENKPIPTASDIRDIKAPDGAIVTLIRADTEAYAKVLAENNKEAETEQAAEPVEKIA